MNEFVAKKLGEVLAFVRIGQEMFERGGQALQEAWGEEKSVGFETILKTQAVELEEMANEATMNKADATTTKLRGMMEAYIGDEWDNPTELLEWSGFYLGSAIVHWALVEGAASELASAQLTNLAKAAIEHNQATLEQTKNQIRAQAKKKVGGQE